MAFRIPPPGPANPCTALVLRQGPEDLIRRALGDRQLPPTAQLLRFVSHHGAAAAEELIRGIQIRAACHRIAGPSTKPFEAALRIFFPEGTEEGTFLDDLLHQNWRSGTVQTGFPETPFEFVTFVSILLGNTLQPLHLREILERRIRMTPPPPSARTAGSVSTRRTIAPRPLDITTIDNFELTARLIHRLERLGVPILKDDAVRKELEGFARALDALDCRLLIGHGTERKLLDSISHEINRRLAGTGCPFLVTSYRSRIFRRMARKMGPERFQKFLEDHLTLAEMERLGEYGRTPEKRQEKFYSRVAGLLAAKRSVLKLLGLVPEEHWLEVEFRLGRPPLSGEAQTALGNRGLLMTAADDGDIGIGIAILEPVLGASGLVGIGVDITTRRARMIDPEQHAAGEAAYKATRRAHPVGRFGSKTAREVVLGRDGTAILTGKTANAARTLRREGHTASPLQVHASIVKVGEAVAAVVMVPVAPYSEGRLEPLLHEIAARLGKGSDDLSSHASRNFSHLILPNPEGLIDSARRLISHGLAIEDLRDGGDSVNRDGILLLRLIGLEWSEIEALTSGARHYFWSNSRLDAPVIQRRSSLGYDFPVVPPFLVETESFRDAMGILPGHRVLDIMCGTGQKTVAVALAHPQAEILGLEINPDNLIQAVSFALAAGISPGNLSFAPHDVRDPFPVEGYDRVLITGYSTFGFNEPMLRHLVQEIKRIVRVGGRIWLDFDHYSKAQGMGFFHRQAIERFATEMGITLEPIPLADPDVNAFAYRVASK